MKAKFWQDWVILACALWLFFSPFIFDFGGAARPAAWSAWIFALLLAMSALEALKFADELGEWLDAGLGVGLMVTPVAFGFEFLAAPAANFGIVGLVVVLCAISAMSRDRAMHEEEMGEPHRHMTGMT